MRQGLRRSRVSAAMVAAVAAARAHAGAWVANADSSLAGTHEDNVRFLPGGSVADEVGTADLDLQLQWVGDTTSLSFRPRGRAIEYRNYHPYNRTEGFLSLSGRKQGERSQVEFTIDGSLDTTITSELGFTGYSDTNKRRRALAVSLAPQWQLSERVALVASASESFNRYADAKLTPLIDYDYRSATVGLQRAVSQRSTLALQASGGRLEVPGQPIYAKDNYQLVLDYVYAFAERWNSEFSWGPSQVRNTASQLTDGGVVYSASLSRKSERSSLGVNAARSVSPNGLGALTRRDVVGLHVQGAATERLNFTADASWSHILNSRTDSGFSSQQLNYLDVGLGTAWKPTPTWTIGFGVHRALQSYGAAVGTAGKTSATLTISWSGLQRVI